jgi:hypothetical protein
MSLRINYSADLDEWAHWDGAGVNIKTDGTTDWCMGGWYYRESDPNINEFAAAIGPVVTGAGAVHGLRVSGTTDMWQTSAASQTDIIASSVGSWIFIAFGATTAASGSAFYGTGTSLTEVPGQQANSATAMDCIIFGHNPASGNSSFRGRIAFPRVYSGAFLSKEDWEAEMVSTTPVGGVGGAKLGSLFAAYRFDSSGSSADYLNDVSGHGRHLTANNLSFFANCSDDPDLGGGVTVFKLKLLAHPSAASATDIAGVVFTAPTGSDITGAKVGEFSGATFEAALESGQAVLKVPCTEFGGTTMTTASTPVALVRNTTNTTGVVSCTVIEE